MTRNENIPTQPANDFEWSEELLCSCKTKINNLIWEFAPASMTLGQADKLAGLILDQIRNGKEVKP